MPMMILSLMVGMSMLPPGASTATRCPTCMTASCAGGSPRSAASCSQHRNHPKCLRKAHTETSSAMPNGVLERHRLGSGTVAASDARTRGVTRKPARVGLSAAALAAKAETASISEDLAGCTPLCISMKRPPCNSCPLGSSRFG